MRLNKSLVAVIGSFLLLGAGCSRGVTPPPSVSETATPTSTTQATTTVTVPKSTVTTVKKPTTATIKPAATKKYTEAVNSYGFQGARIQFGNCSGNPSSLSLKVGVKFMIDNRDGVTRIFGIGKAKYYVEPYGFAIVSVPTAGNYIITCNGGGAAQLIVQN